MPVAGGLPERRTWVGSEAIPRAWTDAGEGHGEDSAQVVDNLPHATFQGSDAQRDAAIASLKTRISEEPVVTPSPPAYSDKSRNTLRRRMAP
jgi:hypothetical protein